MKGEIVQQKYKIIRTLGRDSFSETFLARGKGLQALRRYVIKKCRPILGDSQAREIQRFLHREAGILRLLSGQNPQIPRLYECFTDGEEFYLIREWIQGITLKEKVEKQGKCSEAEVKEILSSILSVLKYIHKYGIVYRELNPNSIILRQNNWLNQANNQSYLPVPIYFGGVKEMNGAKQPRRNQRSLVLATNNEYISPEQEKGQSEYASDLYSLGLTAIYLLTGKTPTELNSNLYTKRFLWEREVPNLSSNLVRIINRAISPQISDRFTNPEEMLQALNSQAVNISSAIVVRPKRESFWTPELKIISFSSSCGLGILGLTFALLNFDLSFTSLTKMKMGLVSQALESLPSGESESAIALDIPTFRVGTPQEHITSSLGEPTQIIQYDRTKSKAFWYRDFIPQQVDLGYRSNTETGTIQQTEISFADSVEPSAIRNALQQLLLEDYSPEIERKIDRVVLDKSSPKEFATGDIQGIVMRNEYNRIHVAIWDRNLSI